jgi:transposase-like protein
MPLDDVPKIIISGAEHRREAAFRKRRKYDEAFKRRAVQMLIESGKPVTTIALSVGVDHSILYRWKKKYGSEFIKGPEGVLGKVVRSNELISLRNEIETIKNTVSHLRGIVRKALSNKYLDQQ